MTPSWACCTTPSTLAASKAHRVRLLVMLTAVASPAVRPWRRWGRHGRGLHGRLVQEGARRGDGVGSRARGLPPVRLHVVSEGRVQAAAEDQQ